MSAGARELVVFLPAVGGDPTFWEPQVAAFSSAYEILCVRFERAADAVSMEGFARDVLDAIAAKGYARAHLVGLSMGGVVALECARIAPERVRSLTLANTWAHQADGEARIAWVESQLAKMNLAEFSRMSLPGLFAPDTPRDRVERGIAVESAKDPAMYLACWRAMLRADLRPVLRDLSVPVLLVGGTLDTITPTDPLLTAIHDEVPTARLVEIEGANHFSNIDRAEAFNRALAAHLRSARALDDDQLAPSVDDTVKVPAGSTAEQLLRLLRLRGVEVMASNSGTDFTPVIDAMANLGDDAMPRVVLCPHENTAIALAHGHALVSRRAQSVMGHVHVGTANMGLGIINARRAHAPVVVMAGRTPLYEQGMDGVRTNFVQWGQESYDQGGSFREFTKWDYELRGPHALDTIVDRAIAIAESAPAGPVYLTLPKEPLCAPADERTVSALPRQRATRASQPDAASLETARAWIARARNPLIVTADLGRFAAGPEALVRFAERSGAGVVEHGKRNFFNFPTEHAHHLGFEPLPHVAETDLVIAVECPVPWIPAFAKLARVPPVIQIGADPLFEDLPLRGFPVDLALAGDPVTTLRALTAQLPARSASRTEALLARHRALFGAQRERARSDAARPEITKSFLSLALGEVLDDDAIVVNEYNLDPWLVPRRTSDSWFENSVASGLGWSLGAALGIQIAAPERTVVVTLGDGSYLFNTPLSAHYVAASERLPILVVVFNDRAWSTIKKSTRGSHPKGHAVRTGRFALCDFAESIAFDRIAESCGGVGMQCERPSELHDTLHEALRLVRHGDRHVLVNVKCERDG